MNHQEPENAMSGRDPEDLAHPPVLTMKEGKAWGAAVVPEVVAVPEMDIMSEAHFIIRSSVTNFSTSHSLL